MFFEILIYIIAGILIGILLGLVPGIHPNIIILFIPILTTLNIDPLLLMVFIVALSISNSIADFIPSIFLGVPDAGNELSILPGHKMLLNGFGYEAVKLTIIGSFASILIIFVLTPALIFIIPLIFSSIVQYIYVLLISVLLYMILNEKRKLVAAYIMITSGTLGILLNQLPVNETKILFPIFSGMFGISMLFMQVKNNIKIPEQYKRGIFETEKNSLRLGFLSGTLGGIISGFLPGVGSSQIASILNIGKDNHKFLTSIGAITTANILISIMALMLIGKTRSGASVAIEQFIKVETTEFILILIVSLITVGISCIITLFAAKKALSFIRKLNNKKLIYSIITLLFIGSFIFSGILGLVIVIISTSIGIIANIMEIKRSIMMAVLIAPTILFYMGV